VKIVGHRSPSCSRHRGTGAHSGPVLRRSQLRLASLSWVPQSAAATASTAPSWKSVEVPSPAQPAVLSASLQHRRCGRVTLTGQKRSFRGGVTAALRSIAVSPAPTFVPTRLAVPWRSTAPNPAVDPVPFGHWTLRDEAAQRRSPLR
jgi:hypothetical protein